MSLGSRLGVLLLLAASLAALPSAATAGAGACGAVVDQDDAGSDRDAGASPEDAVQLPRERAYAASISYPHGPIVDTEDWFTASWEGQTERRVMVNVTTRAAGLTYGLAYEAPSTHLDLEAYAPGAEEPTHVAEADEDGVVRLDFTTEEAGTWSFRVSLEDAPTVSCPSTEAVSVPTDVQTYDLYWGCNPHCVQFG